MVTQSAGRSKAGHGRDVLDGHAGCFQQALRPRDALPQNPFARWDAGCVREPPDESPPAHARFRRESLDGQALVEMFAYPNAQSSQRIALGRYGWRNELGLAALTIRRDHETAGNVVGDLGTMVLADDMNAKIETGGAAGRTQDLAVVGIKNIWSDIQRGILACEGLRMGPPSVQETGRGQDEDARANRHDSGPARMGAAKLVQYGRRRFRLDVTLARHDDRAGLPEEREAIIGDDPHAASR